MHITKAGKPRDAALADVSCKHAYIGLLWQECPADITAVAALLKCAVAAAYVSCAKPYAALPGHLGSNAASALYRQINTGTC